VEGPLTGKEWIIQKKKKRLVSQGKSHYANDIDVHCQSKKCRLRNSSDVNIKCKGPEGIGKKNPRRLRATFRKGRGLQG